MKLELMNTMKIIKKTVDDRLSPSEPVFYEDENKKLLWAGNFLDGKLAVYYDKTYPYNNSSISGIVFNLVTEETPNGLAIIANTEEGITKLLREIEKMYMERQVYNIERLKEAGIRPIN